MRSSTGDGRWTFTVILFTIIFQRVFWQLRQCPVKIFHCVLIRYGMQLFPRVMLRRAAEKDVTVSLYIAPIHARLLEALDATGLWPAYEQWKRDITKVVDKVQSEQSVQTIALWDFSGYNRYSMEALPEQPDQAMKWYIDSSHFSDALGKRMLDQMYTREDTGFGIQLTPSAVESHLVDIRYQQQAYRQLHQQQRDYFSEQARHFLEMREKNGKSCNGTPSVDSSSA